MSDAKPARASMLQVAVALGAVYLIWGSTYLAIRFAIETIPPFLMAGARYLTAGTLLYAWSRFRGAPRPSLVHWRSAVLVGALLLLLGNGGVVLGRAADQLGAGGAAGLDRAALDRADGLAPRPPAAAGREGDRRAAARHRRPGAAGAAESCGRVSILLGRCRGDDRVAELGLRLALRPAGEAPRFSQLATAMQMLGGGSLLFLAGLGTGETAHFALAQVSTRSSSPSPT